MDLATVHGDASATAHASAGASAHASIGASGVSVHLGAHAGAGAGVHASGSASALDGLIHVHGSVGASVGTSAHVGTDWHWLSYVHTTSGFARVLCWYRLALDVYVNKTSTFAHSVTTLEQCGVGCVTSTQRVLLLTVLLRLLGLTFFI